MQMSDHIERLYLKAESNPARFAYSVARYCAEDRPVEQHGAEAERLDVRIVLAFDYDQKMSAAGFQEFFTNGYPPEPTLAALDALGATESAELLRRALAATPANVLESFAHEADRVDEDDPYEPDFDDQALLDWEETIDPLDERYYDMDKQPLETTPIAELPPQPVPLGEIQRCVARQAIERRAEMEEIIEPVFARFKAEGKI